MDLELEDKVIIVTGASRGLGSAIAKHLIDEGACVVAAARSEEDLNTLQKHNYERILPVRCDLSIKKEVQDLVAAACHKFGNLHGIVNNAGIAPAENSLNSDIEIMENTLKVNVIAPAIIAKIAAKHFVAQEQGGSIVNIASTSGLKGKASLASYSASKGALLRLTESLAAEWARYKIRINAIAPGAFETSAQAAVLENKDVLKARLRKIPQRRMGRPEEIAPMVSYLLSPISDFVTGACFVIDGGEVSKL
tara:strand:+ start:6858 stop:7610 length:753 start_codon:yes stop_codon:yes gene_type:complete